MSKKRNKPGPGFACRRPGTPQFDKKMLKERARTYAAFLESRGIFRLPEHDEYEVRFGAFGFLVAKPPTESEWRLMVEATWQKE